MINLYLSMCVTCQKKMKKKRDLGCQPILHSENEQYVPSGFH